MSIGFLHPVFEALTGIGCSDAEIGDRLAVDPDRLLDGTIQIPASLVYSFLGWAAERADDAQFAARCGQRMARGHWAPLLPVFEAAGTVGDFLIRFSAMAASQSRAAIYRLEVEGEIALWRLTRPKGTAANATHADAMALGFFTEILSRAAGRDWAPERIVAVLPDIGLIPADVLPRYSVMTGSQGASLRFPSEYLTQPLAPVETGAKRGPDLPPPGQPVRVSDRLRLVLSSKLDQPEFGIEAAARAMGLKPRNLQQLLRSEGTSLTEIRTETRRQQALTRVADGESSVSTIAGELGYSNRANFSRAFRGWTGLSPRAYRKAQAARASGGEDGHATR